MAPGCPGGPWAVGEETAILHGGFLLAARLLQPRPLRELRKADWPRAGRCPSPRGLWKEEAVAIVWAKILLPAPPAAAAALEWGWKEDGFFSVGAMIPDVNHTALFELVKALGAPRLFVRLLLALPSGVCRGQLESLVEYISSETSPSDVSFFLDVWWEPPVLGCLWACWLLGERDGTLGGRQHCRGELCYSCGAAPL
uniref:Uncharacterized protein n=1 Tax=Serinus canaria TaxID=9135 RepID=A0A8C9N6C2_SERCA